MMSKKKLSSWIIILENFYCVIINEYFLNTLGAASFFLYIRCCLVRTVFFTQKRKCKRTTTTNVN